MRIERWYWLPIFCVVSMLLHWTVAVVTNFKVPADRPPAAPSIEVSFSPTVAAIKPKPLPKPIPPKPVAIVKPKPKPSVARGPHPAVLRTYHAETSRPIRRVEHAARPIAHRTVVVNPVPVTPKRTPAHVELPEHIASEAPDTTRKTDPVLQQPTKFRIAHTNRPRVEGGGSPSPGPVPGGHDGYSAPETPLDHVIFAGGGKGGTVAGVTNPRVGGGGGKSILTGGANPLGTGILDDKPGVSSGTNGGRGTGANGGYGSAKGRGVGTDPAGKVASLRGRPGTGIGNAPSGSQVGNKPPGGGKGRGAEAPGTGGTGNGYGRGKGTGVGEGSDEDAPPARMRGVPFGNVAGLLGGGDGGPRSGAPGRGAVFGTRVAGGGEGVIHIVYALDVSGSMRDGNKIGKAKDALKKALGELKRTDTFNIIIFKHDAVTFREDSVYATVANVANARAFVDEIRIGDGTNISRAMDLAFDMNGITHLYLMSDGEPNGGINDFNELRRYIRAKNTHGVKITTLALGLGENFPGVQLLKGIAEDNNGAFDYIDMRRVISNQ